MKCELLDFYIDSMLHTPVVLYGADGGILMCNESFREAMGFLEKPIGMRIMELFKPETPVDTLVSEDFTIREFHGECLLPGNERPYNGYLVEGGGETLLCLNPGNINEKEIIEKISIVNMELAAVSRELSRKNREIEQVNDRSMRLLRTDYLTGIGNRMYYFERLAEYHSRYIRNPVNRFGAVMCDLDKFKSINDTFGHDAGDRALIQFAECIRGSIRKEDVFSRIGGDEFAMIIECNDLEGCRSFVGKLYKKTASLELKGTGYPINASFGYAHINEGGGPEELLKRADDSLYEAKKRL